MRCVLLVGIRPSVWARMAAADWDRIGGKIQEWFENLADSGAAVDVVRFPTWKKARTVDLDSGVPSDLAGPLLVGSSRRLDSVLVGCVVVDVGSLKAAVKVAGSWPVPDAVVEVRPLDIET